jgi:uncharacterized protein (DUF305 family)
MSKKLDSIVISSALAIAAVSCGGSNSPSNTPTAAGDEQSTIAGSTESTQPPMASGSTGIDSSSTSGSDGAPLGTRTGKLNDAQIAAITDSVNSAEIEQARIARSKSQNEQVRRFASMMIEHHSEARAQQAALNLETAESPLSQQLAIESQATLETLKARTGPISTARTYRRRSRPTRRHSTPLSTTCSRVPKNPHFRGIWRISPRRSPSTRSRHGPPSNRFRRATPECALHRRPTRVERAVRAARGAPGASTLGPPGGAPRRAAPITSPPGAGQAPEAEPRPTSALCAG